MNIKDPVTSGMDAFFNTSKNDAHKLESTFGGLVASAKQDGEEVLAAPFGAGANLLDHISNDILPGSASQAELPISRSTVIGLEHAAPKSSFGEMQNLGGPIAPTSSFLSKGIPGYEGGTPIANPGGPEEHGHCGEAIHEPTSTTKSSDGSSLATGTVASEHGVAFANNNPRLAQVNVQGNQLRAQVKEDYKEGSIGANQRDALLGKVHDTAAGLYEAARANGGVHISATRQQAVENKYAGYGQQLSADVNQHQSGAAYNSTHNKNDYAMNHTSISGQTDEMVADNHGIDTAVKMGYMSKKEGASLEGQLGSMQQWGRGEVKDYGSETASARSAIGDTISQVNAEIEASMSGGNTGS